MFDTVAYVIENKHLAEENAKLRARIAELEGELKFELHDRKEWMKIFVARTGHLPALEAALGRLLSALDAGILENAEEYTEAIRAARAALENTK